MIQSLGINALVEKRSVLVAERDNMLTEFNNQIKELESCIELLSGKDYQDFAQDYRFDDDSPNYIRSSAEEI